MKKTIIYLGLALVSFANVSFATTSKNFSNQKELVCNAIAKGDLQTVKKFIEYGVNVNETSNGLTPLMMAARYNKVEIIKMLLDNGAKTNIEDEKGFTALQYATLSNATDAIALLKKK